MYIVFGIGCGDQEDQVDRLSVQRIKIHAVFDHHGGQAGAVHKGALAVGDGDAFADAGGAFLFPPVDLLTVCLPVIDFAALDHQVHHLIQGFLLGAGGSGK